MLLEISRVIIIGCEVSNLNINGNKLHLHFNYNQLHQPCVCSTLLAQRKIFNVYNVQFIYFY